MSDELFTVEYEDGETIDVTGDGGFSVFTSYAEAQDAMDSDTADCEKSVVKWKRLTDGMTHQAALIEILRIVATIPGEALGSRAQAIWTVTEQLEDPEVTFLGAPAYEARPKTEADQRVDWAIGRALEFEEAMRGRLMVLEQQIGVQESLKESISMSRDRLSARVAELEARKLEEETEHDEIASYAAKRIAELEAKLATSEISVTNALGLRNEEIARAVAAEAALREAQTRYDKLHPAPEKCPKCGGSGRQQYAEVGMSGSLHDCPACLGGKK